MNWINQIQEKLSFLVPRFLHRIDDYLLINYPFIWRTRVHYFLFFSLIIANPMLWFLGQVFPFTASQLPDFDMINGFRELFLMGGIVFLLFWVYDQYKLRLGEQAPKHYLLTWVVYIFCIFLIFVNTIVFSSSLVTQVAHFFPDEEFQEDLEFHSTYNYWDQHPDITEAFFDTHKERIQRDVKKYGVLTDTEAETIILKGSFSVKKGSWLEYKSHDRAITIPFDAKLSKQMSLITEAKHFLQKKGSYISMLCNWRGPLFWSFISGTILLLLVHPFLVWYREWEPLLSKMGKRKVVSNKQALSSSLEETFITQYPHIWSTQVHTYFALLFKVALCFIALELLFYAIMDKELFSYVWKENSGLSLIGVFILPALIGIIWIIRQTRQKELPAQLFPNILILSIYYFVLCLAPTILTIIIYGVSPESHTDGTLMYFSIISFLGAWLISSLLYFSKLVTVRRPIIPILMSFPLLLLSSIIYLVIALSNSSILQNEFLGVGLFSILFLILPYLLIRYFKKRSKDRILQTIFASLFISIGLAALIPYFVITENYSDPNNTMLNLILSQLLSPLVAILLITPVIRQLLTIKNAPSA